MTGWFFAILNHMNDQKIVLRAVVVGAIITIATGVTFYHYVEHMSWLDAFYFSIITLTTVGYGDIHPVTPAGKIFTTLYIIVGVGIITAFITIFAKWRTNRRVRKISEKR